MNHTPNKTDVILITGAKGLVGMAIVSYLTELGYSNLVIPSRTDCNLINREETFEFFEKTKPSYVFHLAATVYGILGNMKNQGASFLENSLINLNVIEASRLSKVKKIVAMGTCAAYPENPLSFPLKEEEFFYGEPHDSEYGYAQAKRAMLANLIAYNMSYDMQFAYVISTNLYGMHDTFDIENGHVIPSLIKKFFDAKKNKGQVIVWGDGSAKRDFLFSEDAARALFFIMQHVSGTVNMASGKMYTIREVTDILATQLDMQDRIQWDKSKPNGRNFDGLDISKLSATGYQPKLTLEQGLKKTFLWFEKNNLK